MQLDFNKAFDEQPIFYIHSTLNSTKVRHAIALTDIQILKQIVNR